jgi:hypothetical protein
MVWGTYPPTEYRSRFFEAAYRLSTAPWIFLANDDMEILTQDWDKYPDLNDVWKLYYFRDNHFNEKFSCHPLVHRRVWEILDEHKLVFPNFKNMGCDTTLWDVTPSYQKVYFPNIEINHMRVVDKQKLDEMTEDYKYYDTMFRNREQAAAQIKMESGVREPKVLIGLSTMEYIRRADFLPYFLGLEKPAGSLLTTVHGQSPAQARNVIIEQALGADCTHIFFCDDDMAFPPDTINRLLKHDKDIVMGLYLMRSYPHFPAAFDMELAGGYNKFMYLTPDVEGLVEITNGGLGCVLIKTEVFKKMERPWVTLGELIKDGWCDDVAFFNRARKAGFRIYLDTECKVGHMMSVNIWPEKAPDGNWYTSYRHVNGNVLFPQTIPTPEETEKQLGEHATV